MMDFKIGEVFSLLRRTWPFLVLRFFVYIGVTLGFALVVGGGAGSGFVIGSVAGNPELGGAVGGITGFIVAAICVYFLREYLLYMVKAGHIAVLVELMDGRVLPEGRAQIEHARGVVRERFAESSVLFVLDQLLKAVLRRINRTFFTIASFIPIPGLNALVGFVNTVLNLSLSFVDEVILARNIRLRSENPWRSGQAGLILYAQNYKAFVKNAFVLAFCVWLLGIAIFAVLLAPAAAVAQLMPGPVGVFSVGFAVLFAWGVHKSVVEPFAMIALMQAYFRVTEGQDPDAEWDARLDKLSRKFGKLKERGAAWEQGDAPEGLPRPAPG